MRILVTGGTGFIGSAFLRNALDANHTLACLSRNPSASLPPGVIRLLGPLSDPPWEAIECFRPDACVHAAWIATPGVYLDSPENASWVDWSRTLLEGLAERGVTRIVGLGTCIEYEISGSPLNEELTPLSPVSVYARSKHRLHTELRPVLESQGVNFAWARVFYPYGEGEHRDRLVSSLIRRLRAGEPVSLRTPGSVKDYLHVEDVARAVSTLLDRSHNGPINLGTGEGVTVGQIARSLGNRLGRPELIQTPANPPLDPLDHVVADSSRLRSLGWRPHVTLEDGLERMIQAASR